MGRSRSTTSPTDFFSRATRLDFGYALDWSDIADALAAGPITGDVAPLDVWARASEAASHAVPAQPDLAEAHASVGVVKFWLDWEWRWDPCRTGQRFAAILSRCGFSRDLPDAASGRVEGSAGGGHLG